MTNIEQLLKEFFGYTGMIILKSKLKNIEISIVGNKVIIFSNGQKSFTVELTGIVEFINGVH